MRSLALLACVLGSAALDACINPCPRRQLMTYVAHTQGGLTKGVDVAARVDADDDWRVVGKVAAADATKLSRAAALQHRLIEEHARRLHKDLRTQLLKSHHLILLHLLFQIIINLHLYQRQSSLLLAF